MPFLFHISKEVMSKRQFPLVIIVPYALTGKFMPNDWYLSNLDQIEIDNMMADKYGFAIAWVYMKGKNYTPQKGIEDVEQTIDRIKEDYNLDRKQIYVMGDCVGGGKALLLVQRKPDLFAGIVVYGPITAKGYKKDIPLSFVPNLYNVPIYIEHGKTDIVSPFENTLKFINEANKYGYYPKFIEKEGGHQGFYKNYRRSGFQFFNDLSKNTNYKTPNTIKYCTYDLNNISSYWLEINSMFDKRIKVEITANYEPTFGRINVNCKNIEVYTILFDKLNLTKGNSIEIYSNNKLSFKGKIVENKIKININ